MVLVIKCFDFLKQFQNEVGCHSRSALNEFGNLHESFQQCLFRIDSWLYFRVHSSNCSVARSFRMDGRHDYWKMADRLPSHCFPFRFISYWSYQLSSCCNHNYDFHVPKWRRTPSRFHSYFWWPTNNFNHLSFDCLCLRSYDAFREAMLAE